MVAPDALCSARIAFTYGSGAIPAVGFGTLIPDSLTTKQATSTAMEVGFRHLDFSERYRNEESEEVMQEIREGVTMNVRFNTVVGGGVPGFIPRAGAQ